MQPLHNKIKQPLHKKMTQTLHTQKIQPLHAKKSCKLHKNKSCNLSEGLRKSMQPLHTKIMQPLYIKIKRTHHKKKITQPLHTKQIMQSPNKITLPLLIKIVYHHPILDPRISSILGHAQCTSPGFCNGMDWKSLVELCPPYIGKLRV